MELDQLELFQKDINIVESVIKPVIEIPEHCNNMKNMPIITDFRGDYTINGDPDLLKIVVTNLLNNAIKYGKEGTEIKINLCEEQGPVVFSIYNEGVGISKKDISEKLFGKFNRLKQKGTEGVKGSGLGLYICKKIIDKHKGKIWVESEEGAWVRFSFSLPRKSNG